MTNNYDFVVTSGGIGPTHDDITYESLGKAFGLPLEHDQETMRRMMAITPEKRRRELEAASPEEREARNRMALFPVAKTGHNSDSQDGARSELIFVSEDKWVPVLRLGGKVSWPSSVPSLTRSCASSPASRACSNSFFLVLFRICLSRPLRLSRSAI